MNGRILTTLTEQKDEAILTQENAIVAWNWPENNPITLIILKKWEQLLNQASSHAKSPRSLHFTIETIKQWSNYSLALHEINRIEPISTLKQWTFLSVDELSISQSSFLLPLFSVSSPSTKKSCIKKFIPSIRQSRQTPMAAIQATVLTVVCWMCILAILWKCCDVQ